MAVKKIIDCSASWCGPCKVFAKTFEKVSEMEQYKDIQFESMDIEDDEILVEKYSIRNVPTTLIFDENDNLVYKLSGNVPLKDLTDVIDNAINGNVNG